MFMTIENGTKITKQATDSSVTNHWMIIVGIIALLIAISTLISIVAYKRKKSEKYQNKKKVLDNSSIDYDNVIGSSFKAKALYDALKGKCHPDKFADRTKQEEATAIFQQLVKYKYDYKKLSELKELAIKKLNIKL